jgi:ParB/RepB/Spo0J family partition protein
VPLEATAMPNKKLSKPSLIPLANIDVVDPTRQLDEEVVRGLIASLKTQPLRYPIHVIGRPKDRYELIAGNHRLEAYKRLGRKKIRALVFLDEDEARFWKWSENLYRGSLDPFGKSRHLVNAAKAFNQLEKNKKAKPKGGKQKTDKGYALPPIVQKMILENRRLNKRSILDDLADMPGSKQQLEYIQKKLSKKSEPRVKEKKPSSATHQAVRDLEEDWEKCDFRKRFVKQPAVVRKAFITRCMK